MSSNNGWSVDSQQDAADKLKEMLASRTSDNDYWYDQLRRYHPQQVPARIKKDPIEQAADHQLIMELLRRGYAVAKMPPEDLAQEMGA